MSEFFIIRLPAGPGEPVFWRNPDASESGRLDSPAELLSLNNAIGNARVAILVPGELVTLKTLEIAGRLTSAVIQSIPYRIEEDLATDVDDVHIAVLGKEGDEVQIAIVENQWMELWQQWLDEAKIHAACWLPDTLALPWQPGQCSVLPLVNHCLFRSDQWEAGIIDASLLGLYENHFKQKKLTVTCFGKAPAELPESWKQETTGSPLEKMTVTTDINLLQGRWKPSNPWIKQLKHVRVTAGIAAVVMLSWFANTWMETWQLNQKADNYQVEARRVYEQLFPGERVIRLRSQLNQKLDMLDKPVENDAGMLTLLNTLAPVFNANKEIQALSLQYDQSRNHLRIEAQGESYDSFSRFREGAGRLVDVNVESMEQQEEQVVGMLVIRSLEL